MRTIWKLKLSATQSRYLVPKGSAILCAQLQNNEPCVWFMCDPSQDDEPINIVIIGTGHEFNERTMGAYIGTFQMNDGQLVFHVFEVP